MPPTKKRKFFKKRKSFTKRFKSGFPSLNKIVRAGNHAVTMLRFGKALLCRQPMPDRYYTWLTYNNDGYYALGANGGAGGFIINWPSLPLNTQGGIGTPLPNPDVSISASNPNGYKNLIFNTNTNTGIYNYCRVWSVRIKITMPPQSIVDAVTVALAPVLGAVNSYSTVVTAGQGPNAISKVVNSGGSASTDDALEIYWRMPSLLGIQDSVFNADANSFSTYSAMPNNPIFANLLWKTQTHAALSQNLGWSLTIQYHCEFFGRVDTGLLDT